MFKISDFKKGTESIDYGWQSDNQFENPELWSIVKDGLNDLIDNQDIEIATKEEYVVGYLYKMISERK